MNDQDKSSDKEVDGLDEGSRDLDKKVTPAVTKEDPAEPRFIDWPKAD
jgi:hypothetical protein